MLSIELLVRYRMVAQTLSRSNSALGAFYRRMRSRLGGPQAITATAHKLGRLFYHFWTSGGVYVDPGIDAYEQQDRERVVHNLQKKAHSLGFFLEVKPISAEGVS